jgi:hypothetical protein
MYGIDTGTGATWLDTFTATGAIFAPLMVDATAVYTCGYQAYLRANNLPTTSVHWIDRFFCGYWTPLRVANGVGFIISGAVPHPSTFSVVIMATGATPAGGDLPEYDANGASPSVVNGVVYAGSMQSLGGGKYASSVYAFAPLGTF